MWGLVKSAARSNVKILSIRKNIGLNTRLSKNVPIFQNLWNAQKAEELYEFFNFCQWSRCAHCVHALTACMHSNDAWFGIKKGKFHVKYVGLMTFCVNDVDSTVDHVESAVGHVDHRQYRHCRCDIKMRAFTPKFDKFKNC